MKPYHREQSDASFHCYFIDLGRDTAKIHEYKESIATMLPSLKWDVGVRCHNNTTRIQFAGFTLSVSQPFEKHVS